MTYRVMVFTLLAAVSSLRAIANDSYTPELIHLAATNKDNSAEIEELVKSGADIDKARYDSLTPLHIAAMQGSIENVAKLIELDSEINKKDMHGHTALDFALGDTRADSQEKVQVLIKAGAQESRPWGKTSWDTWSYKFYQYMLITYPVSYWMFFTIFAVGLKKTNLSGVTISFSASWFLLLTIHLFPNYFYGGLTYFSYRGEKLVHYIFPLAILLAYFIGVRIQSNLLIKIVEKICYTALILGTAAYMLFFVLLILALSSGS